MVGEQFSIRPMLEEDIPFGLSLGENSGWNQVPADWLRIFRYQPQGCFVGMCGDERAGTITTTSYGTELAWIGMMLVHPDYRRRGYATALMTHAMDWLREQGVQCIKLDATPAGAIVYEQLGFQLEWEFHRWVKPGDETVQAPCLDEKDDTFGPSILDQNAFGVERTRWLDMLAADSKVCVSGGNFGMLRTGRLADYLGPVISSDDKSAELIVSQLIKDNDRPIFWDVPGPNAAAKQLAKRIGFAQIRPLLRMWYGEHPISGNLDFQYALASPATG